MTAPQRNHSNGNNDQAIHLSVTTSKPDFISEMLEATRKMTRYFKISYKIDKSNHVNNINIKPPQ